MTSTRLANTALMIVLGTLVLSVLLDPIATDEAEHIHFSYMVSLGLVPFQDFWQHHLPLTWYLTQPLIIAGNNLATLLLIHTLVIGFIIYSIHIIVRTLPRDNYLWALTFAFAFFLYPFERATLRPEIIVLPLVSYIIVQLSGATTGIRSTPILSGLIIALSIFTTPRIFPIILVYLTFITIDLWDRPKDLAKLYLGTLIPLIVLAMIFPIQDILFFVFKQSSILMEDSYYIKSTVYVVISITISLIHLIILKKFNMRLGVLKASLIILYYLESAPFLTQSTMFLSMIDLLLGLQIINAVIKNNYLKKIIYFIPTLLISHESIQYLTDNNGQQKTVFDDAAYSERWQDKCDGKTIQTKSFNRNQSRLLETERTHPLFLEDSTYFGFYQTLILNTSTIRKVVFHNETMLRSPKYIASGEDICFFNEEVKRELVEALKNRHNETTTQP